MGLSQHTHNYVEKEGHCLSIETRRFGVFLSDEFSVRFVVTQPLRWKFPWRPAYRDPWSRWWCLQHCCCTCEWLPADLPWEHPDPSVWSACQWTEVMHGSAWGLHSQPPSCQNYQVQQRTHWQRTGQPAQHASAGHDWQGIGATPAWPRQGLHHARLECPPLIVPVSMLEKWASQHFLDTKFSGYCYSWFSNWIGET